LKGSESYIEVEESLKTLREKKKSIETELKSQFSSEFVQMDDIKIDIASDQEMINDIAMTMVMKGETVSVNDKYENEYEPLFSVKFKKVS